MKKKVPIKKVLIQLLMIYVFFRQPFLAYERFSEGNMIFGYLYVLCTFISLFVTVRYYLWNFRNPKNPENTENT